jgi:prophage tail gpP-like protein
MPLERESVAIVIGDDADPRTGRIGSYFGFWSNVEITRSIDTYSTVTFNAPFEPDRLEFRSTFRPFTFQRLECLINLETIVTGFSLGIDPNVDWNGKSVAVTGYSKPAVLGDVNMPPLPVGKSYQYDGQWLRRIASQVCEPFGIGVDFQSDDVKPFKKVKLEIDKKPQGFLVDLAKQRELVMTDNVHGELVFWKSIAPGKPVVSLVEGRAPFTKVTPNFSPQDYFSDVTGYGKKKRGYGEARWPAANPWLTSVVRPKVFKLEDSERADVPEATRSELGRMFAKVASYRIEGLPSWRDPQGKLWTPNTTLKLHAPGAMIYRETEFLIKDVTLKQTPNEQTATLEVVMPGAFSGEVPDSLPWLEPD